MRTSLSILATMLLAGCTVGKAQVAIEPSPQSDPKFLGWTTNGPSVLAMFTNPPPSGLFTNAAGAVIHRPVSRMLARTANKFDHFLPESLNNLVWTNFIAHTNGRSTLAWSVRRRPEGWPTIPPVLVRNTNSLIWGMKGLTALSPSWELEGNPGQIPITALSRRHGYTRGHSMGPDGFRTSYAGKKVWFVTVENQVVETTILREVVRTSGSGKGDYTIVLFRDDLPSTIEPIRVVSQADLNTKYLDGRGGPSVKFYAEQGGQISAQVPGFMVPIGKGGDSGSPIMLPMPGELVLCGGISISAPNPTIQADMDELCRLQKLDPQKYQMQWVDLSAFPDYK